LSQSFKDLISICLASHFTTTSGDLPLAARGVRHDLQSLRPAGSRTSKASGSELVIGQRHLAQILRELLALVVLAFSLALRY